MANPDTNSIFYKIGELTKQKIASEVANVSSGGGGGGGGGLSSDASVTINVFKRLDNTDITVLTISVAGDFLQTVDASDNTQNISVSKFDVVSTTQASSITAQTITNVNQLFVYGDTLYYVTDDDHQSANCTVDEISKLSVYTDYNVTPTPTVPNLADKGLTITYDNTNGSQHNALTFTDHVTSPISFNEPGLNLIDLEYKSRIPDYYKEFSYTADGDIDAIDIWKNNTKTTKLFTKAFTYTTGNLTQILITDVVTGETLTKTIAYDGDGNVSSITKDYG